MLARKKRSEATDVYSLAYMIAHIYEEVRLPYILIISKGLAKNPSKRPTARQLMSGLIKQRSTLEVDNSKLK